MHGSGEATELAGLPGVSWFCGDYCWFAFVLWCGYFSVSFQSVVLRHLVIAPVLNTKNYGGAARRFGTSQIKIHVFPSKLPPSQKLRLSGLDCT